MPEYIEREAVIEAFENGEADVIENYGDGRDFGFGIKNIKDVLSAIPAAAECILASTRGMTQTSFALTAKGGASDG